MRAISSARPKPLRRVAGIQLLSTARPRDDATRRRSGLLCCIPITARLTPLVFQDELWPVAAGAQRRRRLDRRGAGPGQRLIFNIGDLFALATNGPLHLQPASRGEFQRPGPRFRDVFRRPAERRRDKLSRDLPGAGRNPPRCPPVKRRRIHARAGRAVSPHRAPRHRGGDRYTPLPAPLEPFVTKPTRGAG